MIPNVVKLTRGIIHGVALLQHDWVKSAGGQLASELWLLLDRVGGI